MIGRLENRWVFTGCWIIAALVLYLLAVPPTGPAVFPDEVCRIAWSRLLSGTAQPYDMYPAAHCQPYYPLLLAPIHWFTSRPETFYQVVLLVNTVAAALCLPLSVRLGIRHLGMNSLEAWVAGLAVLAFPSVTLFSHHALPETLLFAGVLLTFSTWCCWIDRPSWRRFYGVLAMSLVLYALHQKMLVLPLALILGAVAGYAFNRTRTYRLRLLITALGLSGIFYLNVLVRWGARKAGFSAGDAGGAEVIVRVLSMERFLDTAARAAGVMTYSTWVTGGLIWLLVGGLLAATFRLFRAPSEPLERFWKNAAFPCGLFILLLGLTALYFSSGTRFDLWFYGRHVNAALAAALLPAVAMVFKFRPGRSVQTWTLVLAVVALLALVVRLPDSEWFDISVIHVIGAGPIMDLMYQEEQRSTLLAYCAAILALAVVVLLARLPGAYRFTALVPFAVISAFIHLTTRPFEGVPLEQAIPSPTAAFLSEAEDCHLLFSALNGGRLRMHQYFRMQYYFPNCTIELFPNVDQAPPGSLVVLRRDYASCGRGITCYDLHPDLVVYQEPDEG